MLGILSMLLPALIVIVALMITLGNCSAKNKKLEIELSKKDKSTGYVLVQDIIAGTEITSDMLKEISLMGHDQTTIQSIDKKELVGKYAKSSFKKGTYLNAQCIYDEEEYSSDMRIYEFDFIDVSRNLQAGEFVDIRIVFPNGEDYIVVNHKQIISISAVNPEQSETDYKIQIKVTEEEILRLASAYVDMNYYPESRIYAVSYVDQFQEAGVVNYPVNSQVFQLLGWNPNLIDYVSSQEEQQHRTELEKNLLVYARESSYIISSDINQEESTTNAVNFFE